MHHIVQALTAFFSHLGFSGLILLGIADSSFLITPLGNDLLLVGMTAQHPHRLPIYVAAAATGSTLGVVLLDLVARKLGEEGICKIAGRDKFEKLKKRLGSRSGMAVAFASLAPPPFPFTTVVATASALKYSRWRLLGIVWITRAIRFTIVGLLAAKFGKQVIRVVKSGPFEWTMIAFIALCIIATAFSMRKWLSRR